MSEEPQKLDYPFAMGLKRKERYGQSGLIFSQRRSGRYAELTSPYELSEADFASLSRQDLYDLVPHLVDSKYQAKIDMAERIQALRDQVSVFNKDGFPYPTQEKPFTWPMHEHILPEVVNQIDMFENFGIKEIRIGLEMEFSCEPEAINGFDLAKETKRKAIEAISLKIQNSSDKDEQRKYRQKIEEISKFNDREIMMYDMIELDDRTKGILEPIFGTSRDGNGYYDARNVLELKLKATDPISALQGRMTLLQVLYEKSADYGLELTSAPGFHVNASFWDDSGNILDDKHPFFETKGKAISEGIAKGFYDGVFVLLRKFDMSQDKLIKFGLYANRDNLLRFSNGRIEVRPSVGDSGQDVDFIVTTLFAGALYGLSGKVDKDMIPSKEVLTPTVHHPKDRLKVLAHLLGNSVIKADGTLDVSQVYLREHDDELEYELGLSKEVPFNSEAHQLIKMFVGSDLAPFLKEFFNKVKIERNEKGSFSIRFPETSRGKYEFILPEINMDKIPPELQERVEAGEEVSHDEFSEYLIAGDRIPRPAKGYSIDVESLSSLLQVKGLKSKFIAPGYNLNKKEDLTFRPKDWSKCAWSRYIRLSKSPVLAYGFSDGFYSKFKNLAKEASKTPEAKPLAKVKPEKVFEDLIFKVNDKDYTYETKSKVILDSWMNMGLKEGTNFLRRAVKINFIGITNPRLFRLTLIGILDDINSGLPERFYHRTDQVAYSNGRFLVTLELDPRFLPVLKTLGSIKIT